MDSQTKLKRVVIKEELVILTGDHIKALILNQFLYWSERTKDFDKFIQEEKERFAPEDYDLNIDLTHGWIYKSAEELVKELMLNISPVTVRRHLTKLIESGYIDQRHNPKHKWDRTFQYRPNIIKIQTDLESMGYALDGYPLILMDASFKLKDGNFNLKNRSVTNEGAIPETTTEITSNILANGKNSDKQSEKDYLNSLADEIASVCKMDIDTISQAMRKSLKDVTLKLYAKKIISSDLAEFEKWWYANNWKGKKNQPPAPDEMGNIWGQFEAREQVVSIQTEVPHEYTPPPLTPQQLAALTYFNEHSELPPEK